MNRLEASGGGRWDEVRPVLDEELAALPGKYRMPLILHYLEGRTQDEIARELDLRAGTISTWLHRGREMLRQRLTRRGIAISGGLLAGLLTQQAVSEAVSGSFVTSTVKAAALMAAGNEAAWGLVSPQVGALLKGGLKAMMWMKIKVAAAVLAASVASTGGGLIAYRAVAGQETKAESAPPQKRGASALTPENFEKLQKLIQPLPGEYAWRDEIPWLTRMGEAREKAVKEDKPILLVAAANSYPLGRT